MFALGPVCSSFDREVDATALPVGPGIRPGFEASISFLSAFRGKTFYPLGKRLSANAQRTFKTAGIKASRQLVISQRPSWMSFPVLHYFVWVTPFLGRPETSRGIAMKV
jgi:hypothetical protein